MSSPLAHRILKRFSPHHTLITGAGYVAALVVVIIFPSFDRGTEIEEHGLMPGYADCGFDGKWRSKLDETIRKIENAPTAEAGLDAACIDAGLVMHGFNFTIFQNVSSSLTYTAVASSRGDSREAVVLVIATNWTASRRGTSRAAWGLGIGVVLTQYLKTVHWLSKDVFVLFVDGSLPYGAGARAWLESYFDGSSAVRRGVLRQAVILDVSSRPSSLMCDVEGINGMVPNQDIVNSYTISAREKAGFQVQHRQVWESVFHHFKNGGVHSSHAPFLELQVPAFTVRTHRSSGPKLGGDYVARSVEALIRCMSNNLQQLHHSFNFYFFTSSSAHVSNGLYLYPVFGMQLPLLSFPVATPAFRDIRSLLIGLGAIAASNMIAGSPIFLLGSDAGISKWVSTISDGILPSAAAPTCGHRGRGGDDEPRRTAAAIWLASGSAAAGVFALILRQYAFKAYKTDVEDDKSQSTRSGVQLPHPLWEAVRASSGFVYIIILAPLAIYSWALAVPLTIICVPALVLARPFSIRSRPFRSALLLLFLLGNLFFILIPPTSRQQIIGDSAKNAASWIHTNYHQKMFHAVPKEVRPYLPTLFVDWLCTSSTLHASLRGDFLVGLYEAARDYNCVGGMLFPVFCFAYWPLIVLVVLIGGILPAQKVEDDGMNFKQLRLSLLFLFCLLAAAVIGGVVWRSYSSAGLGTLQW